MRNGVLMIEKERGGKKTRKGIRNNPVEWGGRVPKETLSGADTKIREIKDKLWNRIKTKERESMEKEKKVRRNKSEWMKMTQRVKRNKRRESDNKTLRLNFTLEIKILWNILIQNSKQRKG